MRAAYDTAAVAAPPLNTTVNLAQAVQRAMHNRQPRFALPSSMCLLLLLTRVLNPICALCTVQADARATWSASVAARGFSQCSGLWLRLLYL